MGTNPRSRCRSVAVRSMLGYAGSSSMIHCCNNRHQESQKLLSPWCPTKNHTGDRIFHIVESNKAGPMLTFIRVEEEKKRGGRRPPGPPHLEIQHHRHQIHPAARLPSHSHGAHPLFLYHPTPEPMETGREPPLPSCAASTPHPRGVQPPPRRRQLTHGQRWDGEDGLGAEPLETGREPPLPSCAASTPHPRGVHPPRRRRRLKEETREGIEGREAAAQGDA